MENPKEKVKKELSDLFDRLEHDFNPIKGKKFIDRTVYIRRGKFPLKLRKKKFSSGILCPYPRQ